MAAGKAELHCEPLLLRDALLVHTQRTLSRNAKPGVRLLLQVRPSARRYTANRLAFESLCITPFS